MATMSNVMVYIWLKHGELFISENTGAFEQKPFRSDESTLCTLYTPDKRRFLVLL